MDLSPGGLLSTMTGVSSSQGSLMSPPPEVPSLPIPSVHITFVTMVSASLRSTSSFQSILSFELVLDVSLVAGDFVFGFVPGSKM